MQVAKKLAGLAENKPLLPPTSEQISIDSGNALQGRSGTPDVVAHNDPWANRPKVVVGPVEAVGDGGTAAKLEEAKIKLSALEAQRRALEAAEAAEGDGEDEGEGEDGGTTHVELDLQPSV